MNLSRLFIWLLGLLAFSVTYRVLAEQTEQPDFPFVRFSHIDQQHDIALGHINAILQDSQGYIWLGGESGLARFDAYSFDLYVRKPRDPHSLSDNMVWTLAEDSEGNVWIGTEGGLNRYNRDTDNFSRFLHDPNNPDSIASSNIRSLLSTQDKGLLVGTYGTGVSVFEPESQTFTRWQPTGMAGDIIWSLHQDDSGNIWVGTETKGVSRVSLGGGETIRYSTSSSANRRLASNTVRAITQDSSGSIWLGTDGGAYQLDEVGDVAHHFSHRASDPTSLGANIVWDILEDRQGYIWIATDGGGMGLLNPASMHMKRLTHDGEDGYSISGDAVRQVIEDRIGDIWAVTFPAGVNVFHRAAENVQLYRHSPGSSNTLTNPSVLSILQGNEEGIFWFGTDGGGLNRYNAKTGSYQFYQHTESENSLGSDAVLSLARDGDGHIWVGTWGGSIARFDPETEAVKRYPSIEDNLHTPSQPNVWSILLDSKKRLWIGTEGGGVNRYDAENDRFIRYPHGVDNEHSLLGSIVWGLFEDDRGRLWMGTNKGVSVFDLTEETFKHYQYSEADAHSLSNRTVLSILQTRDGRMWFGTRAGLNVLDEGAQTFTSILRSGGLANDVIGSIAEDDTGRLWLGTSNGLSTYDPNTREIKNYNQTNWGHGAFNYGSVAITQTNELLFGGVNGVVRFHPSELKANTAPPPIVLTDFQLFNKTPSIGGEKSPLTHAINHTDSLTLSYKQSVFSFEFAALNYYGTESNQYAYKLEGFDQGWNYVGDQRKATYTNINAGDYTFRVKASNNEGVWNEAGPAVGLRVTPAPWKTWWAYSLYGLAFVGALATYARAQQRKIAQERSVNQRLRYLDKLKDDFLANTSHELRTPLHGIIGLADSLTSGAAGELSDVVKYNLRMISGSGKRLANLVNDILDYSKIKNSQLVIDVQPLDLKEFADAVVVMSRPLIGDKEVDLTTSIPSDLPAVLADEHRLQQALYNLIGNAIKFTESGSIVVEAELKDDKIWVHVRDTGIGIPAENLELIFASFEQIEDHRNRRYSGTGLGLAITKQLVELHHGEICVASTVGEGSTFSFSLPVTEQVPVQSDYSENSVARARKLFGEDAQSIAENTSAGGNSSSSVVQKKSQQTHSEKDVSLSNEKFRILIVDDEPVNRQVLVNQLAILGYQLDQASGGQEALDKVASAGAFDLILLDIMMPKMNGYEVCAQLRSQFPMYELPIIFLTAKNLISDLVDGFEVGANDFLTKPIAAGELSSRVRTHLQLLEITRNLEFTVEERTEEVRNANRVLQTLDGIVATINKEVIFERIIDVIASEACHLFDDSHAATFWSFDEEMDEFHCASTKRAAMPPENVGVLTKREFIELSSGKDIAIGSSMYVLGRSTAPRANGLFEYHNDAKAILAMSLSFDDCVVGLLVLVNTLSENAFKTTDLHTLSRFSAHAKSALTKARLMQELTVQNNLLEKASLTDQLTGLRNRRYLLKYLDSDIALILRAHHLKSEENAVAPNSDIIFFLLDIDHFKDVNDTYGHSAGDQVLVQMKQILQDVFRDSDFLIRWGGEEFLMVARFSSRGSAPFMAERLRRTIESHEFDIGGGKMIKKTCSIGFSSFPFFTEDATSYTWTQIVDIADLCLYCVKKSGRNAWLCVEPSSEYQKGLAFEHVKSHLPELVDSGRLEVKTSLDGVPLRWD